MAVKTMRSDKKEHSKNYKKADAHKTHRKTARETDSNTKRPKSFSSEKKGGGGNLGGGFHTAAKSQGKRGFHDRD
jgi:hypothetical protein